MLSIFFTGINGISHAEIILGIVNIMDLFVKYLIYEQKISPPPRGRWKKVLKPIILYEVFVVLGTLSARVDSFFECEEEMNTKLFEVLMMFRSAYNYLLCQDHSLW